MSDRCAFSNVTRQYLKNYECILDTMIEGMTSANLCDSISHNFITQMIPHHEAAIEMSENLLRVTTNIPLQNIARQIICEQTKSIEDMRCILQECSQMDNTEQALCVYQKEMDCIRQTMFSQMKTAYRSNSVDCNFIREMIPHHIGAVKMSELTLQYPICCELKPVLQSIICSQKKGIEQMQRLSRCICGCGQ